MLKLYPADAIETEIRKMAYEAGIPITQLLAPYLKAIAEKKLTMVPHFPAPESAPKKDAA